jgi:hypothetical protein
VTLTVEFQILWSRHYPDIEPVGYELLSARARHWVRFHSLPHSKRYPDTDAEWSVLLARQNELASNVLGENQGCWLVQSHWEITAGEGEVVFQDENDPFRATTDYDLKPAITTLRNPGTEFQHRWVAFAGPMEWSAGRFDRVLRDIANERAAPTLWISNTSGSVFAPYDGGVDLFLPDKRRVRELREQHPDWLSAHPLGL